MYYQSAVILVLLNLYCYASPIPSMNQNQQTALIEKYWNMKEPVVFETNELEQLHQYEFLRMLCELYGRCSDDYDDAQQQQIIDYGNNKYKRLSKSLFHGIPKFGKRAFSSAFAGIPKFG